MSCKEEFLSQTTKSIRGVLSSHIDDVIVDYTEKLKYIDVLLSKILSDQVWGIYRGDDDETNNIINKINDMVLDRVDYIKYELDKIINQDE